MNSPLISIIIPIYNRAHLIGETLDSILVQTYENWECIIVDDGSTDETEVVIDKYLKKDRRFKYHPRPKKKPKGANSCRNYGLDLSQGTYILFYDSDDVMLTGKLQLHIDMFGKTLNFDATVANSYYYSFEIKKSIKPWRENLFSNNLITEFILQETGWQTGDALWRKQTLFNLRFNEALQSSQDWEFHIKALCLEKKIMFNDICMSYIRHTPKSIKNSFSLQKTESDFLSRKSVISLTKNKKALKRKAATKILKEIYRYFEIFVVSKSHKFTINSFLEIIKLTIMLNNYKSFFKFFCVAYPKKFAKKMITKKL